MVGNRLDSFSLTTNTLNQNLKGQILEFKISPNTTIPEDGYIVLTATTSSFPFTIDYSSGCSITYTSAGSQTATTIDCLATVTSTDLNIQVKNTNAPTEDLTVTVHSITMSQTSIFTEATVKARTCTSTGCTTVIDDYA